MDVPVQVFRICVLQGRVEIVELDNRRNVWVTALRLGDVGGREGIVEDFEIV